MWCPSNEMFVPGASVLPRVGCLEENTLFGMVAGQLDDARREAALLHADGCPACRELLAAAARQLTRTAPVEAPGHSGFSDVLLDGKYRLLRVIGAGGMGAVFEAVNTWTRRRVAIKIMHPGIAGDTLAAQRFMQEAQSASRIRHPNVVDILDLGADPHSGARFIVQEFLTGATLRQRLVERGKLSVTEALAIMLPIVGALVEAHAGGVVHRDLKPENIFLTRDGDGREVPKLIDFGVSKMVHAEDRLAVTDEGRQIGTPFYMSPEQLRAAADLDGRTDVWSVGVVLFELVSGSRPFTGPSHSDLIVQILKEPVPRLAVPGVPAAFALVVERALRRERSERFDGRQLQEALERCRSRGARLDLPSGNPYRGLLAFEAEHRSLFFGRDAETAALVERLQSERFVLVAGDSGAGKSSLVRAGVLPRFGEGALGCAAVVTAILSPGRHPWAALRAALAGALGVEAGELDGEPPRLPRRLAPLLAGRPLVVFIDQMEELLTLAAAPETAALTAALSALLELPSFRLVATARSDFLARLSALDGIGAEVTRALYFLRPLGKDGLREAVVGPANLGGLGFESPAMVDELCAAAERSAGALPLVQFALAELWEARDPKRGLVGADTLRALGGVAGALARHADGVLALLPGDERPLARRILTALVTADGTRAQRSASELAALVGDARAVGAVLETLVKGRLVTVEERGHADSPTYQLAHDALVEGWDTLRGWRGLALERDAARRRLGRAAEEWHRLGRPREGLWSPRQLAEAGALDAETLSPIEGAFLAASTRAARRRRRLGRALVVGVPVLVAIGWGGAHLAARRQVDRALAAELQKAEAAFGRARALDGEVDRLRARAFAAFDARHSADGEAVWDEAQSRRAEATLAFGEAGQALEWAMALDPRRAATRRRFAELLYVRARAAERDGQLAERDELAHRLAAYDDDHGFQARWNAPARLTLTTSPPGATVSVQRYRDDDGRRRLDAPAPLGTTPLDAAPLPAGSYVLTLAAGGGAAVRYPVLLGRGEAARLDVAIGVTPPDGYVYVPPGRFLSGSRDDDNLRRTVLNAAPLHEVRTGGYFIARHEVTFGEWLTFVRALPPRERAARLPHTGPEVANAGASIRVEERAGAFRLRLRPAGRSYVVDAGEPLRYQDRTRRATQDWLRLPVSGVSWDDVIAYARWLDRTGRLPGARPCDDREWERAARGADDRLFPLGDRFSPDDLNVDETYGRKPGAFGPDEVGSHPASDSPFGVADLAGNVWEWVASTSGNEAVLIRGGSFYHNELSARSDNREPSEPSLRAIVVGVRVCADANVRNQP